MAPTIETRGDAARAEAAKMAGKSAGLPVTKASDFGLRKARKPEPNSIATLVSACRRDYQFSFAETVLRALISSVQVSIEVDGGDSAQALADHLTALWDETLPDMLDAIFYGRQAFERTYEYDGNLAIPVLDAIPYSNAKMRLTTEGGFDGIDLMQDSDTPAKDARNQPITLPVEQSWWLAIDDTITEPHGKSKLLGAPQEVLKERTGLFREIAIFLNRFAVGIRVARAPSAPRDRDPVTQSGDIGQVDVTGQPIDPIENMAMQVNAIESGGTLALASEMHEGPDGTPTGQYLYSLEMLESATDATALYTRLSQLDAAVLRSLGIPERAVTQDAETGSYSMAETHKEVLYHTVESLLLQIIGSFQKYVVDVATSINYWSLSQPTGAPTLTVVYQPLAESDRLRRVTELVYEVVGGAGAGGVSPVFTSGLVDLPKLLEQSELPLGEDPAAAMELLKKLATSAQQPAQQPAAAAQPGIGLRAASGGSSNGKAGGNGSVKRLAATGSGTTGNGGPPANLPHVDDLANTGVDDSASVIEAIADRIARLHGVDPGALPRGRLQRGS